MPDALSPAEFGATFKRFMDAMVAEAEPPANPLRERLTSHLGSDPSRLSVTVEEYDTWEHPNVQVAIDDYLSRDGRHAELTGVSIPNKRFGSFGLSDIVSHMASRQPPIEEGPADFVNFHLTGDRVLSCLQFGLYLISDEDTRLLVFVGGPTPNMGPRGRVRVEVMGSDRDACNAFLAAVGAAASRLNVYRGHVISLSPGEMGMGPQTLVQFHSLAKVERDDVVLPPGLLDRIERHTMVFARHAERLLAAGRALKRGLLLYGAPGTGKTFTVNYLAGQMPDRTVILTTGRGMGMTRQVAQMARSLAPSMVVLEDVDLIAEHRGQPFMPSGPILFELLNEMDGLRNDCDVIFTLTTNRPDILEPALAARPGRIDLAVELPLPDADGRQRLLELYGRGLRLEGIDLDAIVQRTDGVSPAYIKELLRKAALLAAEQDDLAVTQHHLDAAMTELGAGGQLADRLVGFRPAQQAADLPQRFPLPTGFPRTGP